MNMKRWLIRTTDKKILGPVLEEKVIDLMADHATITEIDPPADDAAEDEHSHGHSHG